ncbi:hypothetical protein Tco_0996230 [Tanacetum coccineum]
MTDVKLVKDLHTTNFDQIHVYLKQHKLHANEVCLIRERNQDPTVLVANHQMTPPDFNTYQSSYNNPQFQQQFSPSESPQYGSIHPTSTQPMVELPFMDSCFVVPVFSLGDDPIACLNKEMAFLTTVASSRGGKGKIILVLVIRVMLLVLGETMQVDKKGLLNATTIKEAGQILDEEQLTFLSDPGISDGQAVLTIIPNNSAFQTEDLDTYDFNYDDVSNVKAVLMANISNYGSDVILEAQQDSMILFVIEQMSKQMINHVNIWEKANKEPNNESITAELERYKERVKTFEQRLNIGLSSREKMIDSQMDDMIKEKLALKEQVDSLEQNLSKHIKEKESLLQTFNVFKNESKENVDPTSIDRIP